MPVIGAFKLAKALLLIVVGVGAIKLLGRDVGMAVTHAARALRVDPDNRLLARLVAKASGVSGRELRVAAVGTFVYAALFLVEGVGLLLGRAWAEWFTVVVTGSFVPLEVYELVHRFTVLRVAVLVLNVAILVYLLRRRLAERRKRRG